MVQHKDKDSDMYGQMMSPLYAVANQMIAVQNYSAGYAKYVNDFLIPFIISTHYFTNVEQKKMWNSSPADTVQSYMDLMNYNMDLISRSFSASLQVLNDYNRREMPNAMMALFNTLMNADGETLQDFSARQSKMIHAVIRDYPKAIRDIEPEFGFHFENGVNPKVDETDRFILYQVMPTRSDITVREDGKPIMIIPPYVLGANILGFLPGENRSYTHCFANQGIPTYIRIMKDVHEMEALQTMSAEDDTRDTRRFCEKLKARHGKQVTLNGYCQGGFTTVCNILSGELDGLADALITCVSPMDGTRSTGLKEFLANLPVRFNNLAYGSKTLPNGNQVADGVLMGWVYKLKSIEAETPLVAFFRDMMMLSPRNGKDVKISKTAAALNYWLQNERTDLPMSITEMSFASYNTPITRDGTLPVKLFGRPLNFKRMAEKKVPWLICYGEHDDLVEKETALAPRDFIDVEVSGFPKGHVAIATSWSDPRSACALHTRFGKHNYRGPVRFHLEMEMDAEKGKEKKSS